MQQGPLRDEASEGGDGGGGNGGAPAFDPAKFRSELLAEFNKGLNGALAKLKTELTPKKADPEPEPEPEPEPDTKKGDPKPDWKVGKLERDLAKMKADLEAERKQRVETEKEAAEKERLSLIRAEIAKAGIADHSSDDAFRYFRDEVKRSEDGALVGPEGQPFTEFLTQTLDKKQNWLPPKPIGGAGASAGNRRGNKTPTLDDIKPGMPPEERKRILDWIQQSGGR
jgi:hypothetical protein